jgi:hypothetical protein
LFAPPIEEDVFFSFSQDGSVKGWDTTSARGEFYDLSEPVIRGI